MLYEVNLYDIDDMRKCLIQTWFGFKQDVIDAAIDPGTAVWDHVCVRGGGHFEHILRNEC